MEITEKLNNFIGIISNLKGLKQKTADNKLTRLTNLITELDTLKKKVYPERLESAKIAYRKNKSALQLSAFELMEYNFRENSHSNVLQYLFDYRLIGDVAIDILVGIIKSSNIENTDIFIEKIQAKKFDVIREKPADDKKRIDLFIVDEENRFVIAIENKILAPIADRKIKPEEPDEMSKNQLDDYRKFVDDKYLGYNKLLILMHFTNIDKEYDGYYKFTYERLNSILNSIEIQDNILTDYKILLQSITNDIKRKNKIELLRKANSWKNKNDIEASLNEIEQIKMLSYGK